MKHNGLQRDSLVVLTWEKRDNTRQLFFILFSKALLPFAAYLDTLLRLYCFIEQQQTCRLGLLKRMAIMAIMSIMAIMAMTWWLLSSRNTSTRRLVDTFDGSLEQRSRPLAVYSRLWTDCPWTGGFEPKNEYNMNQRYQSYSWSYWIMFVNVCHICVAILTGLLPCRISKPRDLSRFAVWASRFRVEGFCSLCSEAEQVHGSII